MAARNIGEAIKSLVEVEAETEKHRSSLDVRSADEVFEREHTVLATRVLVALRANDINETNQLLTEAKDNGIDQIRFKELIRRLRDRQK